MSADERVPTSDRELTHSNPFHVIAHTCEHGPVTFRFPTFVEAMGAVDALRLSADVTKVEMV